jgi:uncharacterized membrane protein
MSPHADIFWGFPACKLLGILAVLALGFWPLTTRVFRHERDRGAGLAFAGGLFAFLLLAQIAWRFGLGSPHGVYLWGLVALASAALWHWLPPPHPSPGSAARMRSAALVGALLFSTSFAFWTLIRSADPGVTHTEQPMDLMWMRAAMASDGPPLRDAWFSGAPATYYSDGHQMLAFLALLAGEPAAVAVNLGQITWFALCVLLAYHAGLRLSGGLKRAGALAVLLLLFVSTPQGALDAWNPGGRFWWWWGASRVLADGPVELITEFPFFSFWLGDNHAHLLGLPILLLSLCVCPTLCRLRRLPVLTLLPCALAIVWSWRIHSWQTPLALALPASALLCRSRLRLRDFMAFAIAMLVVLPLLLPSLPGGMFQGIALNRHGHSSALDLLNVFGFFVPGLLFIAFSRPSRFVFALLLLAAGLIAVCEILVVKDLFQSRMNTVFKAYYQAWMLLAVVSAVGWAKALRHPRLRFVALATLALPVAGLLYSARLSGEAFAARRRSLDAWSVLPSDTRHLLAVADRLIQPGDLIAEAPGVSYDANSSLLGTWTAGDTILGWTGHQQQWRPGQPHPDPSIAYRLTDVERSGVRWILLGPREQDLYAPPPEWLQWMDRHGERVVDAGRYRLWRLR